MFLLEIANFNNLAQTSKSAQQINILTKKGHIKYGLQKKIFLLILS